MPISHIIDRTSLYLNSGCNTSLNIDAGLCFNSHCLPTFIIAGVMKSGTGALMKQLNQLPHILSGKSITGKNELHFFGNEQYNNLKCPWQEYIQHFHIPSSSSSSSYKQSNTNTITFEKSPNYIRDKHILIQIKQMLPNIKLIIILRNPTDRTISEFHHHCRHRRYHRLTHDILIHIVDYTKLSYLLYTSLYTPSDTPPDLNLTFEYEPYTIPYHIHTLIEHYNQQNSDSSTNNTNTILSPYSNNSSGNLFFFPKGSVVNRQIEKQVCYSILYNLYYAKYNIYTTHVILY